MELLVVIPVYNEERSVGLVLEEWAGELGRCGIDYGVLFLDDGSTDATPEVLSNWKRGHPSTCVEIMRHTNQGHGQTCILGYRIACERKVPWVFQIDSDGQCDPAFFARMWVTRGGYEVVYGYRAKRKDGLKRILASVLVKAVVRVSAGVECIDANVPYRLMRTEYLRPLLDSIPPEFDLANIALATQIRRAGWREVAVPIVFRPRTGGEPSVPLAKFAQKALQLFLQLKLLPAVKRR